MKKIIILLIVLFTIQMTNAQVKLTISMNPRPIKNINEWASGGTPLIITAQAILVQGKVPPNVEESRILVTIKSAGKKICGSFTEQTAPKSSFTSSIKTWSGVTALGLLGNECPLQPGSYEFCVQLFSSYAPIMPLSVEVCKSFTIADDKQITYSSPQNLIPVDGKNFTQEETKQPIQFRWTQVTPPPPNNDITYVVYVYLIEKGGTAEQAVKSSSIVFEKVVKTLQTIWQMPSEYIIAKERNPFAWYVEAFKGEGINKTSLGKSIMGAFCPNCEQGRSFCVNCEQQINSVINNRSQAVLEKIEKVEPRNNTTDPGLCKNLKVGYTKASNSDPSSYEFFITNRYAANNLSLRPKSFRITSNNSSIISANAKAADWDRIPPAVPPNTNNITWTKTSGYIPTGQTFLGNISFENTRTSPFYLTYEWLDSNEKIICKDSILINQVFYHSLSTEYLSKVIDVKDTLYFQIDNSYSNGSNKFTYTITNLSNNKTTSLTKLDTKNNQGLIRIHLPLQNSGVARGESGQLTLTDNKKYYYISFKRN